MSDISQGGAPAEAAPAGGAPAEAAPVAPPAEAEIIVDPFDAGQTTFGRSYVEKLRGEAAKYRTSAKPYEEHFGGYSEEDRQVWFQLAKEFQSDPVAAAEHMELIAKNVREGNKPAGDTQATPEGDPQYLTQDQLNKMLSERDAIAGIKKELGDLGYQQGTPEFREVLYLANEQTGGDLKAAHDLVAGRKQAIIDEFVKNKSGQGGPRPVTASGEPASQAQPVKTFADARESALARLRAGQ